MGNISNLTRVGKPSKGESRCRLGCHDPRKQQAWSHDDAIFGNKALDASTSKLEWEGHVES